MIDNCNYLYGQKFDMSDEENYLFDYFGMFVEDKHSFAEDTNSFAEEKHSFDHFDSNDNRLIGQNNYLETFFVKCINLIRTCGVKKNKHSYTD